MDMFTLGFLIGFAACGLIAVGSYKELERRGHRVECRDRACRRRDNPWLDVTGSRAAGQPAASSPASPPSASR